MATNYNEIYEAFFDQVQNSPDFFNYFNLSNYEAMTIAKERAKGFLKESITKLTLLCTPDIDFTNRDDENEIFNVDLTINEINLLAKMMFEALIAKDRAKLAVCKTLFSPKELEMFSPANERKTFLQMHDEIKLEVDRLIDLYASRDRITGAFKPPTNYTM